MVPRLGFVYPQEVFKGVSKVLAESKKLLLIWDKVYMLCWGCPNPRTRGRGYEEKKLGTADLIDVITLTAMHIVIII